MRKWIFILYMILLIFLPGCEKKPVDGRDPGTVVMDAIRQVQKLKSIVKNAKENADKEKAAQEIKSSAENVEDSFTTEEKAKLVTGSMMLLDLEEVKLISQDIKGKKAEVITEHEVAGFGFTKKIPKENRKRTKVTFNLEFSDGRWKIDDLGGGVFSRLRR
mgnify:CR=1 FL=1